MPGRGKALTAAAIPGAEAREPAERALALALAHVNASAREAVEPGAFLAALRAPTVPEALTHHVRAFFDETEVETLSDLVRGGAIGYAALARGARACLPPDHETRLWLDERA